MFNAKIFLICILFSIIEASSDRKLKYWLISCEFNGCTYAFNTCFNCIGENNCKECISSTHQGCSICANDIFNEDLMEVIDGVNYLVCDPIHLIQTKVCHLFCRGQFKTTGQCVRVNNIPVCECSSESLTTLTSTTTKESTTSNESSGGFSGTLNISFGIPYGYQKFFTLPDGDLVRGSSSNFIEVRSMEDGSLKKTLTSSYVNPNVFGILSNGDLIAGYASNKTLLVWDLNGTENESLKRIMQTTDSFQYLTVLENDDLAIAQNQYPYDIIIRSSQNGMIKKILAGHQDIVYQIIELPNGNLLSCSYDKSVKEWNVTSGLVLKSLMLTSHGSSMVLLNNGNLAVGQLDGTISIWNLESVFLIRNLIGHLGKICYHDCLQILENGDLLSASYDRTIKVWNVYDGIIKNSYRFLVHQIGTLPNGNFIGSSSIQILVWN